MASRPVPAYIPAMRYIGNKTRLLGFIRGVLDERGVRSTGAAVDPFSGTASVARALKQRGMRVTCSDLMEFAYVFGRAYVELAAPPDFSGLAPVVGDPEPRTRDVVDYLNRLPPVPGFVYEQYTPEGEAGARHGRMYFTPANAARIDGIRTRIEQWSREDVIDGNGRHLLLAALIEAADRVANTTGVYASFVKSWQPNATRPLRLRVPEFTPGNGCRALRRDALELVSDAEAFELLYLDPPYNSRQYPGYYHIPELLAVGWFEGEPELRGKTGLLPDGKKRSDWARQRQCEEAFETLVAAADCRHIVMSYNAEGIIPEDTIQRVLRNWGRRGSYERYPYRYRRYRSDADGENRRYSSDEVKEYLYCVNR